MPAFMKKYIDQWASGDFISDLNDGDPPVALPDQLDRAALDACVGNNFFPGIEASVDITKNTEVWRARREFFTGDFPASTLVEVRSLAKPEVLVEIEAIAYLGRG